jgi:hypothetical protein
MLAERIDGEVEAETTRVLTERLRIALQIILGATPLFLLGDHLHRRSWAPVIDDVVTVAQFPIYGALLVALRHPWFQRHVQILLVLLVIEIAAAIAVGATIRQEPLAAAFMILTLILGWATLFPWGVPAQLVVAVASALLGLWSSLAGARAPTDPDIRALLAFNIGLAISVYMAYHLRRAFVSLVEENVHRRDAEEALRRSRDDLEAARRRAHRCPLRGQPQPPGRQGGGGSSEPHQDPVPRQHEPRAAHADERRARHGRTPAGDRADRRAARVCRNGAARR